MKACMKSMPVNRLWTVKFTGLLITVFISLVQNYIKLVLETVVISSRIYGLLTGPEQL